jgi:hypothetical protein
MGWDYVSELRPPTGQLLIPQVTYEHREPWWNDIDNGKYDSSTWGPWQSYKHEHLVAKQEELAKEIMNLAFEVSLSILRSDFFACCKILQEVDGFTFPLMAMVSMDTMSLFQHVPAEYGEGCTGLLTRSFMRAVYQWHFSIHHNLEFRLFCLIFWHDDVNLSVIIICDVNTRHFTDKFYFERSSLVAASKKRQ